MTEVKLSAEPNCSLRPSAAEAPKGVSNDDPRLHALREACQLADTLKDAAQALVNRSLIKGAQDPMTLAQGCNSLTKAVVEVEHLIRQLDEALATQAAQANLLQEIQ